jgi:hypothetical protein
MKWQCALLQRWLPEYPDGDLPAWGRRWLKAHVAHCSSCRQELAEIKELVAVIGAAPSVNPGPEFWTQFSRDLHLQLVQAAQEAPATSTSPVARWFRLPYLVGVPVLAMLLLVVAVHLTGPGSQVQNQALVKPEAALKMAAPPQRAPAPPVALVAAPAREAEQVVPVALEAATALPAEEGDLSGWDLDAELAGMTDHEKEVFLNRLHQRGKDGSCVEKCAFWSWS